MKFWASPKARGNPAEQQSPSNAPSNPVVIVSASRMSEPEFWQSSNLGSSLGRARLDATLDWNIQYSNQAGLSAVYNRVLASLSDDTLVAFVHDDVFVYDYFLATRIREGLSHYDVIGVVGHPDPHPLHVGWGAWRPADQMTGLVVDDRPKSGAIEHSPDGRLELTYFGPVPQPVKLMDGVFLATRVGTLRNKKIAFDEQFKFHFYDLDFCRTCLAAGLTLGTWPIALSHASLGSFGSNEWETSLAMYKEKWLNRPV